MRCVQTCIVSPRENTTLLVAVCDLHLAKVTGLGSAVFGLRTPVTMVCVCVCMCVCVRE